MLNLILYLFSLSLFYKRHSKSKLQLDLRSNFSNQNSNKHNLEKIKNSKTYSDIYNMNLIISKIKIRK